MSIESDVKFLTTRDVLARQQANPELLLLDVRMPEEWESHHIPGATLLPLPTLVENLPTLDPNRETIVLCEHGVRSQMAAQYLVTQAGFTNVGNLSGGMSEWTGPEENGA